MKLLTFIGPGTFEATIYTDGQTSLRTPYYPAFLVKKLNPSRVLAVFSPAGRNQHQQGLREALQSVRDGLTLEIETAPPLRRDEDLMRWIEAALAWLAPGDAMALDVTHAPAPVAAAAPAIAALATWRGVHVKGIFSAATEARDPEKDETSGLDLQAVSSVHQWVAASEAFRLGGTVVPLARLVSGSGLLGASPSSFARTLDKLAVTLASGLPVHLADACLEAREALPHANGLPPHAGSMLQQTLDALGSFGWRDGGTLSEAELDRQTALCEWYVQHGNQMAAVHLLREIVISRVCLSLQPERWREQRFREESVAPLLAADVERYRNHQPTEVLPPEMAALWDQILDLRARLATCGVWAVGLGPEKLASMLKSFLRELGNYLEDDELWQAVSHRLEALRADASRVVVAPLGILPAGLYTLLHELRPDFCVVLTTSGLEAQASVVAEQAGSKTPVEVVAIAEGPVEVAAATAAAERAVAAIYEHRLQHSAITIGLGGGTPLLHMAAQQAYGTLAAAGCNVRLVVLADRRPPEQQRAEPFCLAELIVVA